MAILEFPTGIYQPNSAMLALAANTQSGGKSPFDGTEQTLAMPGAHWVAELRWNRLPSDQWRKMQAFVASLNGRAGRFRMGFPHLFRRGNATGAPVVFPANQTGAVLQTGSWTASSGAAFRAGDLVGYVDPAGRNVLHMVTADCFVGGDGASNVPISPPIRRSPASLTPLNLAPVAIWKLTSDTTGLEYGGAIAAALTLSIEEALF